jgi:hypothetical protein
MALIVEDGTGLATAESYSSVAEADQYHSDRGNTTWAPLVTAAKEQALRKATEYMIQTYRQRWASFRTTFVQALDWPRAWVPLIDAPGPYGRWTAYVPYNVVPVEIKRACSELALISVTSALAPALTRTAAREKVGEIDITYDPNAPEYTRFRSVDMLVSPFLTGMKVSAGLVRV